jgi:hypothetical protein
LECVLQAEDFTGLVLRSCLRRLEKRLLQLHKVCAEVVDAEVPRASGKVGIIAIGSEFQNVAEVVDAVVVWR